MTDAAAGGDDAEISRLVDRRMSLAREWEELVEQVRALGPEFVDFLRPLPLEKLLPAAAEGPVAIINVSRWRCDALLVVEGEVRVCELPGLTADKLERYVVEYLAILHAVTEAGRAAEGTPGSELLDEAELRAESALQRILLWLWEAVTEPVLTALGFDHTPEEDWPRLWWCPTGLLTLLPLHAAGDHSTEGPDRPTVLDRVVSSYTPTLRALVEARKPLPEDGPPPRMLVVTVPDAPGVPSLDMVGAMGDRLGARFATACTPLTGPEATTGRVAAELPRHRWVHLACHGDQNLDDPSRGGLWLHDGLLTIAEVGAGHYQAEFAFLSACKTATGGVALADEAITLAAALHYTGFRHVIGTLWTVFEGAALRVAETVYGDDPEATFDPGRSAWLLHQALRDMRNTERLTTWSPFTHIGP
jgi:hypothetical protein